MTKHFVVTADVDGTSRTTQPLELLPTDVPNLWTWMDGDVPTPVHIVSDGVNRVRISIRGYAYDATVLGDELFKLLGILSSSPAQRARVTRIAAPMPGLLKTVFVKDGQEVRKGDTLFTLEAMKMENAIKTPASGVVRQLAAVEGQAFEKGTLLCVIDPAGN